MHDSFWTHAGTVDEMNRLLREAFVELHSRPLLQELADELQARGRPPVSRSGMDASPAHAPHASCSDPRMRVAAPVLGRIGGQDV